MLQLSALHCCHQTVQTYHQPLDVASCFLCTAVLLMLFKSHFKYEISTLPGAIVYSLFSITTLGCSPKCVMTPSFSMHSTSLLLWMLSKFNFPLTLPHPGLQQAPRPHSTSCLSQQSCLLQVCLHNFLEHASTRPVRRRLGSGVSV